MAEGAAVAGSAGKAAADVKMGSGGDGEGGDGDDDVGDGGAVMTEVPCGSPSPWQWIKSLEPMSDGGPHLDWTWPGDDEGCTCPWEKGWHRGKALPSSSPW